MGVFCAFRSLCPIFFVSLSSLKNQVLFASLATALIHKSARMEGGDEPQKIKSANKINEKLSEPAFKSFADFVPKNMKENAINFLESGIPHQAGYGFMMGYSSGFCLKKISKLLAFGLGGIFIMIQTLSYNGLINVHYDRLQRKVEDLMDLNNDGKVDADDFHVGLQKINDVVGYQMPAGGGFATGLLLGLRG